MRNTVRHEDSMSVGSLGHVFGCEAGVLVRGSAVRNIVIVHRALCKHASVQEAVLAGVFIMHGG